MSSSAVLGHDAFAPPRLPGMRPGLVLALIVHVLLVLALAWSVNWKTKESDGVVAELWSAAPQFAAPRPVAPEPTPTPPPEPPKPVPVQKPVPTAAPPEDAQIAMQRAERERRQHEEEERVEAEKKAAALKREAAKREDAEREKQRLADEQADKKKLAEKARQDDAKQAAIRAANLRRMMNQAGTSDDASATGNAAVTSGPSSSYAGIIRGKIKPLIQSAGDPPGNSTAVVEVRLASDGTVLSRRLVKSSGYSAYDDAVLRAIDKLAVFPKDNGRIYTPMTLDFHPRD